jgi:TRAP-type mannitol/chloroaromatic compound transport system substrate-binding protein
MDEQLKAWDIIIEKFNKQDPFFKKVVESQKAWSKRHGAYALNNAPNYQLAYEHYFGKL